MFDFQTIILSAGLSTRLRPFSLERPKILSPIGNIPLISHLVNQLQSAGITNATLKLPNTEKDNSKRVSSIIPDGFNLEISFPRETSGGNVPLVRQSILDETDSFLIIYGDSFLSVNFNDLIKFHNTVRRKGGLATILFHKPKDLDSLSINERTYHGIMSVDTNGLITRFKEKPYKKEIKKGFDLANAAVFICERKLLDDKNLKEALDFSYDIFEAAVNRGLPLYGFDIEDGFRYDVGSTERLYDINMKVLRGDLSTTLAKSNTNEGNCIRNNYSSNILELPVMIGDNVSIGKNTKIGPDVIIGNNSIIEDNVIISHSLIMESCYIAAETKLDFCIMGPYSKINKGLEIPKHSLIGPYSIIGGDNW